MRGPGESALMGNLPRLWMVMLAAIGLSYLFLDRPICQWIYDHGHTRALCTMLQVRQWPPYQENSYKVQEKALPFWKLAVEWPIVMTGISPFLVLIGLSLGSGRTRHLLIFMGLSILFTFLLKNDLKWIFSRYWPLTWMDGNPSWIGNHVYGFQWFKGDLFQGELKTGSFPSGHTAIAFAALLPVGCLYPKAMPYALGLAVSVGVGMVAFDYHFLSDVLAGALTGITCAVFMERILRQGAQGLATPPPNRSPGSPR
jgi:membrane-associated phospholipid phosphatase